MRRKASKGFLLNHLISDVTPKGDYANADPVTGQAAWFDLRVRIAQGRRRSRARARRNSRRCRSAKPPEHPLRYGANSRNLEHPSKTSTDDTLP